MNFLGRNDDEDRSNTLVPKGAVDLGYLFRLDLTDLAEVDYRLKSFIRVNSLLAEYAVDTDLLESAAQRRG